MTPFYLLSQIRRQCNKSLNEKSESFFGIVSMFSSSTQHFFRVTLHLHNSLVNCASVPMSDESQKSVCKSTLVSTNLEAIFIRIDDRTDLSSIHESGETMEKIGIPFILVIPSNDITATMMYPVKQTSKKSSLALTSFFTHLVTFLLLIKFLNCYKVPLSIPDLVLYSLFQIT